MSSTFTTKDGGGALFTRDVGNIKMDLTSVEKVTLNTLGGVDNVHPLRPGMSAEVAIEVK